MIGKTLEEVIRSEKKLNKQKNTKKQVKPQKKQNRTRRIRKEYAEPLYEESYRRERSPRRGRKTAKSNNQSIA